MLYCGLEDGKRRMQSRVAKILGHAVEQWPANFTFRERLSALDAGGLETIEAWLIEHATTRRLVVVDTYGKVRGMKARARGAIPGPLPPGRFAARARDEIQCCDRARASCAQERPRGRHPRHDLRLDWHRWGRRTRRWCWARLHKGIRFYLRGRDVEEQDKLVEFDQETGLVVGHRRLR